ncbi:hypothetical protein FDENT_1635 [Fusarium denticulatum]|uniref:Uncharacterized protein n=1 Tax=Fusarium denticulatum TaxID=48507 RepID=A0A8H6CVR1_9HYPO|nr:hypothetical protein FDENT_1635 [Fusarium denticulatum]
MRPSLDVDLFCWFLALPEAIQLVTDVKTLLEPHFMPHKLVLPNGFLALLLGQTEACDLEVWTALSKSQPFGPLTAESLFKKASPNAVASDQPT